MEGLKELPQGTPVAGGPTQGEDGAKKAQEEQMRRDMMATVLDTGARERCTSKHPSVNSVVHLNQNLFALRLLFSLVTCVCMSGLAVSRIALVSPERSQQIESILLRMAQSGQLRGRVRIVSLHIL